MDLAKETERLVADDATIRSALADAHLPSLLPALAYALGDLCLLEPDLRIDPDRIRLPNAGLDASQLARVRELAFAAIVRFRDSGCRLAPPPNSDDFKQIVSYFVGGMPIDGYLPMMNEEVSLVADDARAVSWVAADLAPGRDFEVVVIGAGMSGILAAHRLRQAGISYVVLEKSSGVGGTWHDNVYPGCRVDIANHFYSYSFAQRNDWPQYFSPQRELEDYFRACAREFGIEESIRFGTEVTSLTLDQATGTWIVRIKGASGIEDTLRADAVISAVGQLNQPLLPDIVGRESFSGPAFHSARWDEKIDLRGKRVAVIGTGCSSVQFAPIVADAAAQVTIFQRTANWMVVNPTYRADVPKGLQWLFRHLPHYRQWYRLFLFWSTAGWSASHGDVDPDWPHQERSVSEINDQLRILLTAGMTALYQDRPDLLAKVVPDYPPAAKRLIVDGGDWAAMLKRDNVELVVDDIAHIDATGITTIDDRRREFDVIIYGTGFQASRFLTPIKVIGRDGLDLHELWNGDDARAYLGAIVPGFPNFFVLYGPNTNLVVSGSIIWFSECTVRYVMSYIEHLLRSGHRALDLRREAHDTYNAWLDAANGRRAWAVGSVNSWYKNSRGRSTQNWPYPLFDYWTRTLAIDAADYEPVE